MYARFTEATIDPKQREQAEKITKSIFAAAKQQKGFKGLSFDLDLKGQAVFLSLWDSKEVMEANETNGFYKEQVEKVKPLLLSPTTRHAGEVKAHEETNKIPKAARLTITSLRKGAEQEATRLAQDVSRAARNEPGFVAWYGVQTEDGKMAAISFWESQDALTKSGDHYLKDALGKLKQLSTTEAQPKVYDVVQHEIPAIAGVR